MKSLIYFVLISILVACSARLKKDTKLSQIYNDTISGHKLIESGYLNHKKATLKSWTKKSVVIKDYKDFGLVFHSTDLLIEIDTIRVEQDNNVTNHAGSKGFAVATDINQKNHGNILNLGELTISHAKGNFLFGQNIKKGKIKLIESDSALYNRGGSNSFASKNGISFIKFDNVISDENDIREINIGKIEFKNSNTNRNLFTEKGEKAGKFIAAIFIDEGTKNINIDSIMVDLPIKSTSKNGGGNHAINYGYFKNKFDNQVNIFDGFKIGTIYLDDTRAHFYNCQIDTLIVKGSSYRLFDSKYNYIKEIE